MEGSERDELHKIIQNICFFLLLQKSGILWYDLSKVYKITVIYNMFEPEVQKIKELK